jgi:hypothetical protein
MLQRLSQGTDNIVRRRSVARKFVHSRQPGTRNSAGLRFRMQPFEQVMILRIPIAVP